MRFHCTIYNRADIGSRNEVFQADIKFTADDQEHAEEVAANLAATLAPAFPVKVGEPNRMEVDSLYELA